VSQRNVKFAPVARDFFPTPAEGVTALLPHLDPGTRFVEPFAGNGALVSHLEAAGHTCVAAYDIVPQAPGISRLDALDITQADIAGAKFAISNPPWTRSAMTPLLSRLLSLGIPCWMLIDAGWTHTARAFPLTRRVSAIVSVGRLRFIPGSPFSGTKDCAWHLLQPDHEGPASFYIRRGKEASR